MSEEFTLFFKNKAKNEVIILLIYSILNKSNEKEGNNINILISITETSLKEYFS